MALETAPDGALWAATTGGILRFKNRHWTKYTRRAGLPSHEWRRVWIHNGVPTAEAMNRTLVYFKGEQWQMLRQAPGQPRAVKPRVWRGQIVSPYVDGIRWGQRHLLPPAGGGALPTAVLPLNKNFLLAAFFGDGLWKFDGQTWIQAFANLPLKARDITALAGNENTLWVGTRREGIFRYQKGRWVQGLQPDEPFFHNTQFLLRFQNALWVSTLEDGLVVYTGAGWQHFGVPELSSNAPRHLTVFHNALYVRHGGGQVDKWDGVSWTKNVFARLPRPGIYALAADKDRLYAAAWGGWSEWDGQTWQHHFDEAALKGLPLMSLLPGHNQLYLATQSRGVALWHRANGDLQWFDERHGLPDDWITTLAQVDNRICAGTFVGGLTLNDGEKWRTWAELKHENVTALEPDNDGGLWVATRHGLWRLDKTGQLHKAPVPWLDEEVQALCATPQGLWVGTRTSLNFLTFGSLNF